MFTPITHKEAESILDRIQVGKPRPKVLFEVGGGPCY